MGRKYGQHFLKRESVLTRIAETGVPDPTATVLEIGPGNGALTAHLLPLAARVVAVEIDLKLVTYLKQRFDGQEKLALINADVLQTDLHQWGPLTVVGNLPYYITSPILERVLQLGPLLQQAVFLVQKEVALRIAAVPGTRDYGYLSVQVQLFTEPELLFSVPAEAFQPPPLVESAVVRLVPRPAPLVADVPAFLQFASRCFAQKRKTLRNNLRPFYPAERLADDPAAGARAEQLGLPELLAMYARLS